MLRHFLLNAAVVVVMSAPSDASRAATNEVTLASPNGSFSIHLWIDDRGQPRYRVHHSKDVVIAASGLGLKLADGDDWTADFDSMEADPIQTRNATWKPLWGERETVRDHYRTVTVSFRRATPEAVLKVEVRAYNEGVAFRYRIENIASESTVRIEKEQTEFHFDDDHNVWAVSSAQGR